MKTIKMAVFLSCIFSVLLTGCKDDETEIIPVIPELEVQASALCDWKGAPVAVAVKTNQPEWLATVNEEARAWCQFIPRRDSIVLKPLENPMETERTAMIIISAGGITDTLNVVQERGSQPYCRVGDAKLEFVWLENTLQTVVETNQTSWRGELKDAKWCTIRMVGNQVIVTAERNESPLPRSGELIITAGRAEPLVVPLSQEGRKNVIPGIVSFKVPVQFAVSDVYQVWNGGQKIAEICNEYVPQVNDKTPVVVAYPCMADGKPDLANGLVVVGGGNLDWSSGSAVYRAGNTTKPLEMLAFVDGSLLSEVPEGTPLVDVAPALLKDVENNRYRMVKIGTQFWLGDNLRTTKYADGTSISKDYTIKDGAWGLFEDIVIGKVDPEKVGLLYNWYVLPRIALQGWHVPRAAEWEKLQAYLGNEDAVLMRKPDSQWDTPCNVTNLSGFSALPNGSRWDNGKYQTGSAREDAIWWATDEDEEDNEKAYNVSMRFNSDKTQLVTFKKGFSYAVRLLRD